MQVLYPADYILVAFVQTESMLESDPESIDLMYCKYILNEREVSRILTECALVATFGGQFIPDLPVFIFNRSL